MEAFRAKYKLLNRVYLLDVGRHLGLLPARHCGHGIPWFSGRNSWCNSCSLLMFGAHGLCRLLRFGTKVTTAILNSPGFLRHCSAANRNSSPMAAPVGEHHNFPKEEEKIIELWNKLDAFKTCLKQSENRPRWVAVLILWELIGSYWFTSSGSQQLFAGSVLFISSIYRLWTVRLSIKAELIAMKITFCICTVLSIMIQLLFNDPWYQINRCSEEGREGEGVGVGVELWS